MTNPVYRQWVGIAKEGTRGTAVTATDFLPLKTFTPKDDIKYLPDAGMRGSMVSQYNGVQGTESSSLDLAGDYMLTSGYSICGVLGDVATTGASAPYTTTAAVLNSGSGQPTSYTLTHYDVASARQYAGCQFTEVGLKSTAEGTLEATAKAIGFASAVQASPPTPSFDTVPPAAAWRGVVTIAGSQVLYASDIEIDFKRTGAAVHTLQNSQQPYVVFLGKLEVTGKITFVMQDETQLNHYLVNDRPSLDLLWSQGTGATTSSIEVHCSRVGYKTGAVVAGKDYFETQVEFVADANVTDAGASGGYSPCKVTLQNPKPAGTFA